MGRVLAAGEGEGAGLPVPHGSRRAARWEPAGGPLRAARAAVRTGGQRTASRLPTDCQRAGPELERAQGVGVLPAQEPPREVVGVPGRPESWR